MPTNSRPNGGTAFSRSVAPGDAAVYRTTPAPGGATATLPAVGAVASTNIWQEVYASGATTPSYLKVVGANQTYAVGIAIGVGA